MAMADSRAIAICYVGVLIGLMVLASAQAPCTEDDYDAQYTQCRPDDTHDLVYYKKRNSTCSGGVPVPDPVFDLNCSLVCPDGQYLPLGAQSCSPCQTGSFSNGNALIVDYWQSLTTPLGTFTTWCTTYDNTPSNCSGWYPNGNVIRSGQISENQISQLQLSVYLVTNGHLHFTYLVDASFIDGLYFYIDGVSYIYWLSESNGFVVFDADLTSGFHTLLWQYSKLSTGLGEDATFISSIELAGLTYAQSSCTLCPPGTFNSNPNSTGCQPCGTNTFSSDPGATSCSNCPDGYYAYQNQATCYPKLACTSNDYQYLSGNCVNYQQTATASWLQPHICDDTNFPLPDPIVSDCSTCVIGSYLDSMGTCQVCPQGTFSNNASGCFPCNAGSYAVKSLDRNPFDSWMPYESTYCTGDCGTSGWRLRSGYIDSGAGHGNVVNSVYQLNVTMVTEGMLIVFYSLACENECTLSMIDYPYSPSVTFPQTDYDAPPTKWQSAAYPTLAIGDHSFLFTFSHDVYVSGDDWRRNDTAKIYAITIDGAAAGGAILCDKCAEGMYSTGPTDFCSNCSAGSTSTPDHQSCIPCTGNTYSEVPGSPCYECGLGTTANENHTDCIDPCTFTINGLTYDLHLLEPYGSVGPITGGGVGGYQYTYYFDICGRGNFPPICAGATGDIIYTHGCQAEPGIFWALDIGYMPNYYPLPNGTNPEYQNLGFVINYVFGNWGCGPATQGPNYQRSSTIYVLCTPNVGLGFPEFIIEDPPCFYNTTWYSRYGCPLCDSQHYSFYYTPCVGGMRQQVYFWLDPILCQGGVSLPPTATVPCSTSVVQCGPGTRLGDDGQSCTPCPAGEYSSGGGLLISTWPTTSDVALPYEYETECDTNPCSVWTSSDGFSIHSGEGDSSLIGSHSLALPGSISFQYKIYSSTTGQFNFYVNGLLAYSSVPGQNNFDWKTFTFHLVADYYVFKWDFLHGSHYNPALLDFQGITIQNILVNGLEYHSDACFPCPPGTYANSSESTASHCELCPPGTYSIGQSGSCTPCPSGQYSLQGAASCLPIVRGCIPALDYVTRLQGSCTDNNGTFVIGPDAPYDCRGSSLTFVAPCVVSCPYSTSLQGDTCVGCPPGQYFSSGACRPSTGGYLVNYVQNFLFDNSTFDPPGFTTGCTGLCGSPGWRNHGSYVESGSHGNNTVDSFYTYQVTLNIDGSVEFSYIVINITSSANGLQFLIDGVAQPIPSPVFSGIAPILTNASLPLSAGPHTLVWNFHQENSPGLALLTNIRIHGAPSAITDGIVPCPPGSFSNDTTDSHCTLCEAGTFSIPGSRMCGHCPKNSYTATPGQEECLPCGYGSSTPSTGASRCTTNCVYNINGDQYDLTKLPEATVYDYSRDRYTIKVCDVVGGTCPNSHACVATVNGDVVDLGGNFRLSSDTNSKRAAASPFAIYFEDGDSTGCPTGVRASTVVHFQCDTTAVPGDPIFASVDNCVYTFTWPSLYACPVCTDDDYLIVKSACSNGHRQISKTRINQCNGPISVDVPTEKCSSHEFPTGAVVAVVVVFVIVVLVAALIVWRNRVMAKRYNQLVEETRSSPNSGL